MIFFILTLLGNNPDSDPNIKISQSDPEAQQKTQFGSATLSKMHIFGNHDMNIKLVKKYICIHLKFFKYDRP